jgi:hypothetical protein
MAGNNMKRLVVILAAATSYASAVVAQDFEPNSFGEMPLGLEGMALQDLLAPQVDLDEPIYQAIPEILGADSDIPTILQNFDESELYGLARDPALIGDPTLTGDIETLSQTPLTSALAEAARGSYNPTPNEYQTLRDSIDPNGPQAQISDFMGLSALRPNNGTFTFSFDASSNSIDQNFSIGETLSVSYSPKFGH